MHGIINWFNMPERYGDSNPWLNSFSFMIDFWGYFEWNILKAGLSHWWFFYAQSGKLGVFPTDVGWTK